MEASAVHEVTARIVRPVCARGVRIWTTLCTAVTGSGIGRKSTNSLHNGGKSIRKNEDIAGSRAAPRDGQHVRWVWRRRHRRGDLGSVERARDRTGPAAGLRSGTDRPCQRPCGAPRSRSPSDRPAHRFPQFKNARTRGFTDWRFNEAEQGTGFIATQRDPRLTGDVSTLQNVEGAQPTL
jgi:hypothetical protein